MSACRRFSMVAAAVVAPAVCAAGPQPDVENGKTTFAAMCGICHSVVKAGGPTQGRNLLGVVGRKAGSERDFTMYTPALKASGTPGAPNSSSSERVTLDVRLAARSIRRARPPRWAQHTRPGHDCGGNDEEAAIRGHGKLTPEGSRPRIDQPVAHGNEGSSGLSTRALSSRCSRSCRE